MRQQHVENIMFTVPVMPEMHVTAVRLYTALEAMLGVQDVGSTLAAEILKLKSAQTINNWESRGVSKTGMVQAETICGIRNAWIEHGELPMFDPARTKSAGIASAHQALQVEERIEHLNFSQGITSALNALENALIKLDLQGRERLAPMFESFARSPGAIIKNDITILLENPDSIKSSRSSEKTHLQKTG